MPFGAFRSVRGFLRVAHSIWFILAREFLVLATNYFDGYIVLGTEGEAKAFAGCIQLFFKLIGWRFAETGSKAPISVAVFRPLVIVDVRPFTRTVFCLTILIPAKLNL